MFSANQTGQVGENQLQLSALAKKKKKRNRPLPNYQVNNFLSVACTIQSNTILRIALIEYLHWNTLNVILDKTTIWLIR
jgi:hypothetical protein